MQQRRRTADLVEPVHQLALGRGGHFVVVQEGRRRQRVFGQRKGLAVVDAHQRHLKVVLLTCADDLHQVAKNRGAERQARIIKRARLFGHKAMHKRRFLDAEPQPLYKAACLGLLEISHGGANVLVPIEPHLLFHVRRIMQRHAVQDVAAILDALAAHLLLNTFRRGIPLVGQPLVAPRNALQQCLRLMLLVAIHHQAEIAQNLGLELHFVRVDLKRLKRLPQLQRRAVQRGRIEGSNALLPGGLHQRDHMAFDVYGSATRRRAKPEAVTAENELISGDISYCRHESTRISKL